MLPCRHGEVVDAVPLARSHRPHGPGKRAWRDQDLQSQSPSRWSPEYGVTAATHPTAFDDGRSGRPHHHLRCLGNQAVAHLLGHELHVRGAETQFRGDLPVGQVQTHEVEAQHPDPQRLVVAGQHSPAEVVEARRARPAAIPLPMQLCVVVPVPDYRVAAASRATDALWPAVLAHQGEALRVVEQGCEVDRVRCGHDDRTSRVRRPPPTAWNHHHIRTRRHEPPSPRKPTRATGETVPVYRGSGSMRDNRIPLDGTWDFLHLVEDYRSRPVEWRRISVPAPWQSQFADLRMRGGTGIYRRDFDIPAGWKHDRMFVRFAAVFHIARVWINDECLGMHVGGFLPFSFDGTDHLREGRNEIKVQVDSPIDDPNVFPDTSFAEIPFGKQSWYGPLSGIWQSVWVERRVADHIERARISPEWETGQVTVRAFLARPALSDSWVCVTIRGPDGAIVVSAETFIAAGGSAAELDITVPDRLAWSPAAPNLYAVRIELERDNIDDVIVDAFEDRFGFRLIETRNGRFYLNGEPFYLR